MVGEQAARPSTMAFALVSHTTIEDEQGSTLLGGYLHYTDVHGGWHRAFFRLISFGTRVELQLFDTHLCKLPRSVRDVGMCLVQGGPEVGDKHRSFSVMTPGEVGVYMQADTEEEAMAWVEALESMALRWNME